MFRRNLNSRTSQQGHNKGLLCRNTTSKLRYEILEDRRMLAVSPYGVDVDPAWFLSLPEADYGKIGQTLAELALAEIDDFSNAIEGIHDATSSLLEFRDDFVSITAVASQDPSKLISDLAGLGIVDASLYGSVVTGLFPINSIQALNGLDSLLQAGPTVSPVKFVGAADSQGDNSQRTDLLRSFQGLTGAGVTVGVISDSYDNGGAGSATTDIGSGDLPGTGNPNGFNQSPNVIRDNSAGTDEVR